MTFRKDQYNLLQSCDNLGSSACPPAQVSKHIPARWSASISEVLQYHQDQSRGESIPLHPRMTSNSLSENCSVNNQEVSFLYKLNL